MTECAFCGEAMRPGATFCAGCGHAPGAPTSASAGKVRLPAAGEPNARAAVAIAAMPVVMLVSFIAFATFGPSVGPDLEAIGIVALIGAPVGGIAWAVWRGATWARWLSLVATLAWAIFMLWVSVEQAQQLRAPFYDQYPEIRRSTMFGLVLSCAQLAVASAALYFLVFPRGWKATASRAR